jgi:hypothetical protein
VPVSPRSAGEAGCGRADSCARGTSAATSCRPDLPATFQLFSASRDTLTARGSITPYDLPNGLALYGSTLVTLSYAQLRTFDIHTLDAPTQLGTLDLHATYTDLHRFGDYLARLYVSPRIEGPEPSIAMTEVQVIRFDATSERPIATWPAFESSTLARVGDNLVVELHAGMIQVYDLSDPARPRKAGSLSSDELFELRS